jgi:transcriptional regulator with XRE-family HTH domain
MNTTINLKFAKRLKELRGKNGYTQKELSDLAGIGYKHYQRYESENPPFAKLDFIEKLAKAFKTTPSKLLDF